MRPHLAIALLIAATLPNGALGWQTAVTGTPPAARPAAVTVDGAGDVIAVGRTVNASGNEDALVVKLDGASGVELWQRTTDGSAGTNDLLRDVAADGTAVVAAGQIVETTTQQDALVVKRTAAGSLAWQIAYDGGAALRDDALAVAVDGSGDVLVGVQATPVGLTSGRFIVLKRKGTDGTSLWVREVTGQGGAARAVAVDGSAVYAAGDVENSIAVTKLDGGTGEPSWRADLAGSAEAEDVGRALAVGAGRVIVAGRMIVTGGHPDFAVIALDATTGSELWRYTADGNATGDSDQDDAFAVAIDAAGDVLAAGRLSHDVNDGDLFAVKLAGATGAELWRTVVDGPNHAADVAQDLALAANGDLFVTGTLRSPGTRADFLIVRFASATGSEQWRTVTNGTESEADQGFAVAALGADVIAGGRLRNGTGNGFVVTRRSGATGGDFPCGNGEPDSGEACDDANGSAGDGCRIDCTMELCGDGIHDPQDGCDDGNTENGDCCSESCTLETGACDDGNACTLGDACEEGVCTPASTTICTPTTPCHTATCNPDTGACLNMPKAEGALCDDGNACTAFDRCFGSTCNGATPRSCADDDPCTVDACDPATGCTFTPYTSFASVLCRFDGNRITDACRGDVPRSVERRMELARRLVGKASTSERVKSVRRSLTRAAKALDKARRLTEKQRRRDRIATNCADVLDAELTAMASGTRSIQAELVP